MKKVKIKNLYIHIGAHKTGSTYLQKFFYDNGDSLALKGIVYPKSGCGSLYGHHDLVAGLKQSAEIFDRTVSAIGNEIDDESFSLLLSSENFEYLSGAEIERLIAAFKFDNVKIIYFYRTWSALLYAMWQEEIKHGSVSAFDNYALKHITFPFNSNLLNYAIPLNNYAQVLGKSNIAVANYEVSKNKGLLGVLLGQINAAIEVTDCLSGCGLNASFNPFLVEAIRMMNAFAKRKGMGPSYKPKHYYINNACSGVEGKARHEKLRSIMEDYQMGVVDFNSSYAFKLVLSDFIEKYEDCFIDSIGGVDFLREAGKKSLTVISSDYLCLSDAHELLSSAWNDISALCNT